MARDRRAGPPPVARASPPSDAGPAQRWTVRFSFDDRAHEDAACPSGLRSTSSVKICFSSWPLPAQPDGSSTSSHEEGPRRLLGFSSTPGRDNRWGWGWRPGRRAASTPAHPQPAHS